MVQGLKYVDRFIRAQCSVTSYCFVNIVSPGKYLDEVVSNLHLFIVFTELIICAAMIRILIDHCITVD